MRHGETAANADERIQHDTMDEPLNERGRQQIIEALEKLPSGITKIYSSDRLRAKESAGLVAEHLGLTVTPIEDAGEKKKGSLPYRTWDEATTAHGEEIKKGRTTYDFRPWGGESYQDFKIRTLKILQKIKEESSGEKVLFVTHGGVLRAMHELFPDKEIKERKFKNASIHEFDIGNVEAILLELEKD